MQPRKLIFSAFLLFPHWSLADSQIDSLIRNVYPEGGQTLYCQADFQPGDRLSLERIYSDKQLAQHLDCGSRRQCQSHRTYQQAQQDRHNLYVVTRRSELARRRTQFGALSNIDDRDPKCGYKQSFQTFEPPAHARGNVARAMFHMHQEYDLPLLGSLATYQDWNRTDPVSEEEQRRNDAIASQQGTRNAFIDNPERADTLSGGARLNLQFR